jgi:hypothetical protein
MEVGVLLQRLSQRLYYGEEMSDQELKDQVAPDASESEFETYVKRFTGILSSISAANMDFKQLEAFLTSQMKKREVLNHKYAHSLSTCCTYQLSMSSKLTWRVLFVAHVCSVPEPTN